MKLVPICGYNKRLIKRFWDVSVGIFHPTHLKEHLSDQTLKNPLVTGLTPVL